VTDQKQDPNLATIVHTSQGNYPVIVGRDVIDDLGLELQKTGQQGRAFIVADEVMCTPWPPTIWIVNVRD